MSTSRRRRRRIDYSLTPEAFASNNNDHFTDTFSTVVLLSSVNRYPRYTQCCKGGVVKLPFVRTYSPAIVQLFSQLDFLANIRAYNAMFSMTSFGAKIDDSVNHGSGPYVFKIEGQVHHWIGSLCPPANERPRFLQMYIYDTENEVSNRLHAFTGSNHSPLSLDVVSILLKELEHSNELNKLFHTARDLIQSGEAIDFYIRLYDCHNTPCYDRPSNNSIGAIVTDNEPMSDGFDIVIRSKGGDPKRISKLHSLYMPLQYLLLFVHGESGWSPKMLCNTDAMAKNRKLTMNMFYSYQLHDRQNMYTLVLRGGCLSQQYFVDAYVSIEQSRLDYVRFNQNTFRTKLFQGVEDAVTRGDTEGRGIGKRTILPSYFTGDPRYMYKHYQDALAICRVHGNPQYFITFTCNVKWPEIERYMSQYPSLKAHDRPDIIARVFQIKVSSLINFLKSNKPFGEVTADLYTIEYQKRVNAEDIDKYITAEIPDPVSDPQLHKVISYLMMHGPCGIARPSSPCMKKGSCSKNFPKQFQLLTSFDKNGYAQYKRRDAGSTVTRNNVSWDNRYVIPYNWLLCLHYQAHINVEYCGWSMLIKYLFKYISKGTDCIRYRISKGPLNSDNTSTLNDCHIDEIQNFVDSRFICSHEACWRIFNFPIHCRNPVVQVLSVHEEHMQTVTFRDSDNLANVLSNPTVGHTTLTGWLRNNRRDDRGLELLYIDYVSAYRWDASGKCWIRRSYNTKTAIGRLTYLHPSCGERFYLRMLLTHQRGCRTFEDIRTVGGIACSTYRDACDRFGLLEDDRE
ncbi:uncharacterized protein LOC143604676 [Bidens hawaiensis]|uniref:uncharacterized protein LOC143604676 n=1 Tax=Bidens hawaiensis TaxID=980011 RepID=UPI004049E18B